MLPGARKGEPNARGCNEPGAICPGLRAAALAAKTEPCDNGAVAGVVLLDQICKKAPTLSDELEEAAAGMIVLREAPQVLSKLLDPFGQERNLHLWRACVAILDGELRNNLILRLPRQRHTILRIAQLFVGFPTLSKCLPDGSRLDLPGQMPRIRAGPAPRPLEVRRTLQVVPRRFLRTLSEATPYARAGDGSPDERADGRTPRKGE